MTFEITFKVEIEGVDSITADHLYAIGTSLQHSVEEGYDFLRDVTVKVGPMGVKE